MLDRWLPWIAAATVLGVFLPPLVSAPSVELSPAAVPATPVFVSELLEPPPMTELVGDKSRFFEPPATPHDEAKPPQPIAARMRSTSAAAGRPAARHVAFHHRRHRRICCVDPVVDKAGN